MNTRKNFVRVAVVAIIFRMVKPQLVTVNTNSKATVTATLGHEKSDGETFTSQPEPSLAEETSTVDPFSSCPEFGGLQVPGSVIKCHCQGREVFVNGKCQVYDGTTVVPAQREDIYTVESDTTNYNVTVRDVNCDPTKYRFFNFTKGQFYLRPRGDMVLLEDAGDLKGQRINNYCLVHHLDNLGDLTWTMKACVPIPSIPRCCPDGYATKEGKCQPAKTPVLLTPPVSANPSGSGVNWPNITNFLSKLTCDSEPMKTIPLSHKQSGLLSLADGVHHRWVPGEFNRRRVYYSCPDFCVDGVENIDGSVDYFTSFCYQDPRKAHEVACQNGPCFHKCCKYGYSMDLHRSLCVPDENSTFNPPVATDLSKYNIVIGYPICESFIHKKGRIAIDGNGNLIHRDGDYPSSDFCADTFLENGLQKQGALTCPDRPPVWISVRSYLFPICKFISLIFLSVIIACHLFVPGLLADGGVHLMCYAISLFTAFSTGFSVNVFHEYLGDSSCVSLAIAMQFGFLATFFWLNVMCFEIWRKIRSLANQTPSSRFSSGFCLLYGWGTPVCICTVTIAMQHLPPDNVWGVIKPYIGISRCWFREDIGTLLYFYGPVTFAAICSSVFIVLTFINYKAILRNFMKMSDVQRMRDREVEPDQNVRPPKLPPAQITGPIQDFSTKMKLFALMVFCWITEVLSWKIPPMELWALTDTLNALQGLFIFIIFLLNRRKRDLVEEKFPLPFNLVRRCQKLVSKAATKQSEESPEIPQKEDHSTVSTISLDLSRATATA